jgi:hypothetical protein
MVTSPAVPRPLRAAQLVNPAVLRPMRAAKVVNPAVMADERVPLEGTQAPQSRALSSDSCQSDNYALQWRKVHRGLAQTNTRSSRLFEDDNRGKGAFRSTSCFPREGGRSVPFLTLQMCSCATYALLFLSANKCSKKVIGCHK